MNQLKFILLALSVLFLLSGTRLTAVFTCPLKQGMMILKPLDFDKWMTACLPDYSVTVQGADSCIYGMVGGRVESVFDVGAGKAIIMKLDDYFITYSPVDSAVVHKGMILTKGQVIGYANNRAVDVLISKGYSTVTHPENMLDCPCTKYPPEKKVE